MKSSFGLLAFAASADAAKKALIVVDMQNDFIKADGGLPVTNNVTGGDATEVVPKVVELLNADIWNVRVVTEDYHPHNHIAFASTHSKTPFSTVDITFDVASGRPCGADMHTLYKEAAIADCSNLKTKTYTQTLWPDHCVQLSEGQLTDPAVRDAANNNNAIWLKMGWLSTVDTYGAFRDNWIEEAKADMTPRQLLTATENSLEIWLKKSGMKPEDGDEVYIAGLAYDVVALKTALQAKALGFKTFVVKDASKAVGTIYNGQEDEQYVGVTITNVAEVKAKTKEASGDFANSALIVTNMQRDYVPQESGEVPVECPEADKIIPSVNTLIKLNYHAVIFTEDEHPHDDVIFASSHASLTPPPAVGDQVNLSWAADGRLCDGPTGILNNYGASATSAGCGEGSVDWTQNLFTDFAVQGTPGQMTDARIDVLTVAGQEPIFLKKSYTTVIDSYDAFQNRFEHLKKDAPKHMSEGALEPWLKQAQIKTLFIMGVGLEKQIKYTALKARESTPPFNVKIIEDGSKMWTKGGFDEHKKELEAKGVEFITVEKARCEWEICDGDGGGDGGNPGEGGNGLWYGGGAFIVLIILLVLYMQMQGGGGEEASEGGTEMVQEQEE